jgi:hypothetical protein
MQGMNTAAAAPRTPARFSEMLPMLLVSAVILVLSSLDQSTRGPSLTAMLLTHLNLFC